MRWVVLVVALASCRGTCNTTTTTTTTTTGDAGEAGVAPATSASSVESTIERLLPKELADVAPFGNDDKRAVCGKTVTGTCDVLRVKSAGKDALGRDLVVVTIRTSEPADAGDPYDIQNGVESREHWVVAHKDGQIVFRAPIAMELAHTDAALDESVDVKTNELTLTPAHVYPSSWHRSASSVFQLSPPLLLSMSDSEFNSNPSMVGTSDTKFDEHDGSGGGSFACADRKGSFFAIPSMSRADGFDPSTGLGKCGGEIDGTPGHGYMTKGSADRVSGFFRVAYIAEKLYVEVHDDHFTDGDRIELRAGRGASGMSCIFEPPKVTKKITIDGGGKVSRPGIIEAKRIRNDGSVRTFEITFTDSTELGAWSGFAIDVIDDDEGAGVRRLSTAAIGPELATMAQLDFTACMTGPDGPVPVPLVRTATETAESAIAAPDEAKIKRVVEAWNAATNAHDASKLASLYANDVEIYGTKMSRERAMSVKNAAFARHDRDDVGIVTVKKNRATFSKHSRSKNGSTLYVTGYIDVDASMKIVAEGDTTTDDNLAHKRETDCVAAIDAVVAPLRSTTARARAIDDDGSVWTVKYFKPRPGGDELDRAEEFEIDTKRATVTRDGVAVVVPPTQMSRALAACN